MLTISILAAIPLAIVALAAALWARNRRLDAQRKSVRALYSLSEGVIAAAGPGEIAEQLSTALPAIMRATSCNLYLYNRKTRSLERVVTAADPEPMAASVDEPPDGLVNAAAVCFRNRTLLSVPDVRRNPLIKIGPKMSLPKSAMFVPVASKAETEGPEILGILEIHNGNRVGYFSTEEQAAAQHLANQVAASLRLQERQTIREQLFRSEKMAATGQLISGVAAELRTPIEEIRQLVAALTVFSGRSVPGEHVLRLSTEAQRASEIVSRLVSFTGKESAATMLMDVNTLMIGLVRFRQPEWRNLGLRTRNRLSSETAAILGVSGQIEQVFLNLLVHAEQRAAASDEKSLELHSSRIAGRVVVDISFSVPARPQGSETEANPLLDSSNTGEGASLAVCQGIAQGHGGEIRFFSWQGAARFEVDLPVNVAPEEPEPQPAVRSSRLLTLMLVEPDGGAQRQILSAIGNRGHRVVPVSPEEAPDLVHRLRFDAVLWAVRSGGGRWSDFRERAGSSVPAFVLISDGYDPELARSLKESSGYLLSRPLRDGELDRVLTEIAAKDR